MNVLGVFAKHWRPGKVKTRLAQSIESWSGGKFDFSSACETSADLYFHFLTATLGRVQKVEEYNEAVELVLGFSPQEEEEEFRWLIQQVNGGWDLQPQSDGDLGQRMSAFFQNGFQSGASKVILIGSDCPQISSSIIQQSMDLLSQNDLVFGPAEDGGYYLVGSRVHCPEIFQGISWSTERVLDQTLKITQENSRKVGLLEPLYDLDERVSLEKFVAEFGKSPDQSLVGLSEKIKKIL